MDQATLVIDRIAETRKLIDRLSVMRRVEVTAAFWMNSLEDDEWNLYLVSPAVDEIGMANFYMIVIRILKDHPAIHLDADDIRILRTDDPTIREAVDFIENYPATREARERGIFLKGHFIQLAYLYPINLEEVPAAGRADP